jgi:hypothetical protein
MCTGREERIGEKKKKKKKDERTRTQTLQNYRDLKTEGLAVEWGERCKAQSRASLSRSQRLSLAPVGTRAAPGARGSRAKLGDSPGSWLWPGSEPALAGPGVSSSLGAHPAASGRFAPRGSRVSPESAARSQVPRSRLGTSVLPGPGTTYPQMDPSSSASWPGRRAPTKATKGPGGKARGKKAKKSTKPVAFLVYTETTALARRTPPWP